MIHILMSRGIFGSPHVVEMAQSFVKPTDQVVIVALSFFEHQAPSQQAYHELYQAGSDYYQKLVASFLPYGILENQIQWIDAYHDQKNSAIQKIQQADILYFPGGAPDQMMERIKKMGIQEAIENHKGLMIGSSAGTMIQFETYYISKDTDYQAFSYQKGLSLLKNFFVEVHYRRKRTQKRAMKRVFKDHRKPIITIPDDGFVIVTEDRIIPCHSANLHYYGLGIYK